MHATSDPNLPLIESARSLIADDRLAEAATVLNQARARIPSDPRVYILSALMAEKTGDIDGAFQMMEKGLSLDSNWAPGIMELAHMQAHQGQFPEAVDNAATALELAPHNVAVRNGAVQVALLSGQHDLALQHLETGLKAHPTHAQWRRALGGTLSHLGRTDESLAVWNALVAEAPQDTRALEGRMHTLLAAGRASEAARDTAALLALDPKNEAYVYYDALAHGQTPERQPAVLNRSLFDNAAAVFDQQLVQMLEYELPQQVARQILARHPARQLSLLDLGCGTGLLGAHLGRLKGRLVGADLSPKMLEQARRRAIYDDLEVADLHDTLARSSAAAWDVIAALDVCIYIGAIGEMLQGAWRALAPGGELIFSCEQAAESGPDLYLHPTTRRYAHKRSHAEAQCLDAGFSVQAKETVLRLEKGQPVHGFVVTATKPA